MEAGALDQRITSVPRDLRASRRRTFRASSLIRLANKTSEKFLHKNMKGNFMLKVGIYFVTKAKEIVNFDFGR